jgi:CRP/FNR family transcriptional regulator
LSGQPAAVRRSEIRPAGAALAWSATNVSENDSAGDLGRLIAASGRRRLAAREVLFSEGEVAMRAYLVRRGLIKLVARLGNRRSRIVRLRAAGSLLGMSGLVGRSYEHSAVAVDEIEVVCIPIHRLAALRRANPLVYASVAQYWYKDLRDADTWIMQFSTGAIRARVARLIEHLAALKRWPRPVADRSGCVGLLTCEEMAAVLGVTPESVSRVLAEFKRSGLLQETAGGPHEWYSCDVSALQAIGLE